MKFLLNIKNFENKLKLLKLVNSGHKTASVFYVGTILNKEELINELKKEYPNNEFWLHISNEGFLEFYNIEKYKEMIKNHYPDFIGLSHIEIIIRRREFFKTDLELSIYYGYFFDIPSSCILEFNYEQAPKERKYISGFGGEISVYYLSENAKNDALSWVNKLESIEI